MRQGIGKKRSKIFGLTVVVLALVFVLLFPWRNGTLREIYGKDLAEDYQFILFTERSDSKERERVFEGMLHKDEYTELFSFMAKHSLILWCVDFNDL